jgi:glutaredoxin-like protein
LYEDSRRSSMPLISKEDQDVLREEFAKHLAKPVRMLMFTQEHECQFCSETREIVEELGALSDQIAVEVYDFVEDEEIVERYAIDKIPAIAIVGDGDVDYGVRFYGIPSGYEFTSLIEDLFDVSAGESGLSEKTKEKLAAVDQPVHLQVFITPT